MKRLALIAGLALTAPIARAQTEPPALALEVEARVLKTAETELGRVERALRTQPGIDATRVMNITLPLQSAIEEDLGRGPVKLSPRAIYEASLARLKQGMPADAVARALVDLHKKGELAHAPAGATAPPDPPKRVASFVFDKERVRFPDPHPPPGFRTAPGEKKTGIYLICVGIDGKVTKVTTVQSLSGADQTIMDQIQSTWVYKPQPVPVCTPRAFVFQFD